MMAGAQVGMIGLYSNGRPVSVKVAEESTWCTLTRNSFVKKWER